MRLAANYTRTHIHSLIRKVTRSSIERKRNNWNRGIDISLLFIVATLRTWSIVFTFNSSIQSIERQSKHGGWMNNKQRQKDEWAQLFERILLNLYWHNTCIGHQWWFLFIIQANVEKRGRATFVLSWALMTCGKELIRALCRHSWVNDRRYFYPDITSIKMTSQISREAQIH